MFSASAFSEQAHASQVADRVSIRLPFMPLEAEFRRKVRTLAGVYQVIAAYPALPRPANRM